MKQLKTLYKDGSKVVYDNNNMVTIAKDARIFQELCLISGATPYLAKVVFQVFQIRLTYYNHSL